MFAPIHHCQVFPDSPAIQPDELHDSGFAISIAGVREAQVASHFQLAPLQQMAPHMNHRDWGPAAKVFDFM